MRVILIIFQKKFVWGKWAILDPKMAHPHNWIGPKNFLKISQNEIGQWVHENVINCFLRKKFIWGNLIFLALRPFLLFDWAWSN